MNTRSRWGFVTPFALAPGDDLDPCLMLRLQQMDIESMPSAHCRR